MKWRRSKGSWRSPTLCTTSSLGPISKQVVSEHFKTSFQHSLTFSNFDAFDRSKGQSAAHVEKRREEEASEVKEKEV